MDQPPCVGAIRLRCRSHQRYPAASGAAVTAQPDQRLNAEEREIVAALERSHDRPLTPEEIDLSLEQARALGEIADNVAPIKRGVA